MYSTIVEAFSGYERKVKALGLLLVTLLMVAGLLLLTVAKPAYAAPATFTVNSTADTDDGACQPRVLGRPFNCTLREAINAANSNSNPADKDLIRFSIPGNGPHTISPTSELPAISQPVTIDGYTEGDGSATTDDDATENTAAKGTNAVLKIVISGANAPPVRPTACGAS